MRTSVVVVALSLKLAIVPVVMAQDSPDALPKVVQHSQPIYPPLARQTGIQGDVRVKLTTDGESVTNAEAVAGVRVGASPPVAIIDYTWLSLGKWDVQLTSTRGKSQRIIELSYSGPDDEWLSGKVLGAKDEDEEIDFGHREGHFVTFAVKLRQPDGKRAMAFFVGNLKGNKVVGTFVDDAGVTGKWSGVRLPADTESR
jgi:hypothetical protein